MRQMGIYEQLNRLAVRFPIKKSSVTIPATSSLKLVDASNCRTYLAFTCFSTNTPVTFSPFPISVSGDGYPTQGITTILEFWIDRHMSLTQSSWYCFNGQAAPLTITIFEVVYSDIEEKNETSLNAGQSSGEVFPSDIGR